MHRRTIHMMRDDEQPHVTSGKRRENTTVTYDRSHEQSVAEAIVTAVSSVRNCTPLELEPLYSIIDPDAMESLFQRDPSGAAADENRRLSFTYADCTVTVGIDTVSVEHHERATQLTDD